MTNALEIPEDDIEPRPEELVQQNRNASLGRETEEPQDNLKQVDEGHRRIALAMWAAIEPRGATALKSKDIIYWSGLTKQEDKEKAKTLLPKYFIGKKHQDHKIYYSWNRDFEVPEPDEPEASPFEGLEPIKPNEEGNTYQESFPNFFKK